MFKNKQKQESKPQNLDILYLNRNGREKLLLRKCLLYNRISIHHEMHFIPYVLKYAKRGCSRKRNEIIVFVLKVFKKRKRGGREIWFITLHSNQSFIVCRKLLCYLSLCSVWEFIPLLKAV